ncbi:MAG: PLP-dependent transferase [archaeon]|nr:PLP-dependent transferase [archaeon]
MDEENNTSKLKKRAENDIINRKKWNTLRPATKLLRAGEDPYPESSFAIRPPIYATKSFAYSSMNDFFNEGYMYTRTDNPTLFALDQKLAALHNGESAICVASGMAAVHLACSSVMQKFIERIRQKKVKTLFPQSNPDKIPNIIIPTSIYSGTYRLLTKIYAQMGIEARQIDMIDINNISKSIDENTKMLYLESPANPTTDIIDIKVCADLIHEVGGKCLIDNTFASPVLQKPLELGADLVIESLTKYINGHGDAIGGAVIGSKNDIQNIRYFWLEAQGSCLGPFEAWLILRGMRTLDLRMERHCSNAMKLAQYLEEHPKIKNLRYPGLESHSQHEIAKKQMTGYSGVISFELGSIEECEKFMNILKLIKVGVSLGDTTSLIEYVPTMTGSYLATWEARAMNIVDTQFRFSVGLEDPQDLIDDFEQALKQL